MAVPWKDSAVVAVCPLTELPAGAVRCADVDGVTVAVFNIDGTLHAVADRCTHARARLSEGELEGDEVVCPVHFGRFHLPTGRALGFPATRDVETFDTVVADGVVHLRPERSAP